MLMLYVWCVILLKLLFNIVRLIKEASSFMYICTCLEFGNTSTIRSLAFFLIYIFIFIYIYIFI